MGHGTINSHQKLILEIGVTEEGIESPMAYRFMQHNPLKHFIGRDLIKYNPNNSIMAIKSRNKTASFFLF